MSTRKGVLVAGNLVLDTVVLPVPDSPPWNTSYWVDAIEHHLGGNGANTSHAIAKLGVPARALGYVGEDPAGDRVLAILQGAGVDTRAVERVDLPTAATVGLVREDGARCFLHCPGASTKALQQAPAITAALTEGCGFFHLANPFGVPRLRSNAP